MNNGFFSLKGVFSLLARNYALMDPQGDRHRDLIELIIIFSLTLLYVYFIFTYPAVRLFYFHLPCWALIFFSFLFFFAHLFCCTTKAALF